MKIGIKIKLTLFLSGLFFVTAFLLGVIMIEHQRTSLEAQMRSLAGTITDEFAGYSNIPLLQKDTLAMELLVKDVLKYPGIRDAYILDDNFIAMAHKGRRGNDPVVYIDKKIIQEAIDSQGPPPWVIGRGRPGLTFVAPITFQGTTVGYAAVSFSKEYIRKTVHAAIKDLAAIAAIGMLAATLLSIFLASGLLRPVFRLLKGTQEISLGNLDYRIPEIRKDELGDLVKSFNRMASELKKKELLKGVFNRYVSPVVADEILKDPGKIALGGERRVITVFFADIRGFTAFSGGLQPEETVEFLNRHFSRVTEAIFCFGGTIDKFIGDAVMGVFGSPIRSDAHLEQAVKAAMAVKKATEKINALRAERNLAPVNIGIGLDSGTVIVGNMGSNLRMDYTAVGEAVNMASRLTGMARAGEILVTEAVYGAIGENVVARRMPDARIKGIDAETSLYDITGLRGRWQEDVEKALAAIYGQENEEVAL